MNYYYRNDTSYQDRANQYYYGSGGTVVAPQTASPVAPRVAAVRVESVAFPGVHLCMSGPVAEFIATGTGWVGCEYGASSVLLSVQDDPTEAVALAYNSVLPVVVADLGPTIRATGAFLRMDGAGLTEFTSAGAGTVNCQHGVGPWEEFRLERQPDNATFAIASVAFPGVYLRMDGRGLKEEVGARGGMVNCQHGVGPWERFLIHQVPTF